MSMNADEAIERLAGRSQLTWVHKLEIARLIEHLLNSLKIEEAINRLSPDDAKARALAAEAVIQQVRQAVGTDMEDPYDGDPWYSGWNALAEPLQAILVTADLSALREHDAKVKAEALEEAADQFDEQGEYRGYGVMLRARATEYRKES